MSSLLPPLDRRPPAFTPRGGRNALPAGRCGPPMIGGNRVVLLDSAAAAFAALAEAVEAATDHVNLACGSGHADDARLTALGERLAARRAAGVRVNLRLEGSARPPCWVQRLQQRGATLCETAPPTGWARLAQRTTAPADTLLLVVDGRLAMVGVDGRGAPDGLALVACVEGPGVQALQRRFVADWQRAGGPALPPARYFRPLAPGGTLRMAGHADATGTGALLQALQAAQAQVLLAIAQARPPRALAHALRDAVRRGVAVDVHVPAAARGWSGLAAAGVALWTPGDDPLRQGCVVDGNWACLGVAPQPALVVRDAGFAAALAPLLRERGEPLPERGAAGRAGRWREAVRAALRHLGTGR